MNQSTKFVLLYVGALAVLAGAFLGLSVYLIHWPWWAVVLGVLSIAGSTILKFMWDVSGFNGGYSS